MLNLSLGWPNYVDSFLSIVDALRANECLPVIASGNEGEGSTRSPGNYVQALSVGAAGPSSRVPDFSGSEIMVRDVDSNPEHISVIRAIIAMGHSLKLTIVAEGVETLEQLNALAALGCDEYQGNLYSKPLPPIDIAARFLAPGELDLQVKAS